MVVVGKDFAHFCLFCFSGKSPTQLPKLNLLLPFQRQPSYLKGRQRENQCFFEGGPPLSLERAIRQMLVLGSVKIRPPFQSFGSLCFIPRVFLGFCGWFKVTPTGNHYFWMGPFKKTHPIRSSPMLQTHTVQGRQQGNKQMAGFVHFKVH